MSALGRHLLGFLDIFERLPKDSDSGEESDGDLDRDGAPSEDSEEEEGEGEHEDVRNFRREVVESISRGLEQVASLLYSDCCTVLLYTGRGHG